MNNSEEKDIVNNNNQGVDTNIDEITKLLDKDMFFSATIANKKSSAALKKKVEVQMLAIYAKINNAISNGQFYVDITLTDNEKNFLSKKGFYCGDLGSAPNGRNYRIKW